MKILRGLKQWDVQVQKVTMHHSHGKEQDLDFICKRVHKIALADFLMSSNIEDKIILLHILQSNDKVLLNPGIFNVLHTSHMGFQAIVNINNKQINKQNVPKGRSKDPDPPEGQKSENMQLIKN